MIGKDAVQHFPQIVQRLCNFHHLLEGPSSGCSPPKMPPLQILVLQPIYFLYLSYSFSSFLIPLVGLPSPPTSSHSQVKVALAQLGAPLTCFLPSSSAGSSSYLFPISTTALHSRAFADSLTTSNQFLVLSFASSFSCLSSTFHHHLCSPHATLTLTGESPSSSCPSSPGLTSPRDQHSTSLLFPPHFYHCLCSPGRTGKAK